MKVERSFLHVSPQEIRRNSEKTDQVCMQKEGLTLRSFRSQHRSLKFHDNWKGLCIKALEAEIDQRETTSQSRDINPT